MRECRGGNLQFLLHAAHRKPGTARAHERSIDLEPDRVAERLELLGGFFDFHGNMMRAPHGLVNPYFGEY